jgi:cyclopropane fatty-acyl-phospholipid synthase-like methyltransferase
MQKENACMSSHWYETFFSGITLDLWRAAVTPEQTRAEVDFAVAKLGLTPGARVLDVPCGNGRHSLALAARGFTVVGVDLAKGFIAEARASALANAEFRLGDMRELPWMAEFDAAICLGNSFGYLEHEDSLDFLRAVADALKPRGRFLLETATAAECLLPHFEERSEYTIGGITMRSVNRYQAAESRLYCEDTYIRGGNSEVRISTQAVYTAAEVKRMLCSAGFRVQTLYGGVDGSEFALGARDLLIVAERC